MGICCSTNSSLNNPEVNQNKNIKKQEGNKYEKLQKMMRKYSQQTNKIPYQSQSEFNNNNINGQQLMMQGPIVDFKKANLSSQPDSGSTNLSAVNDNSISEQQKSEKLYKRLVIDWQEEIIQNRLNYAPAHIANDGSTYRGYLQNFQRYGPDTFTFIMRFTQIWDDGSIYVGEWRDDKRNGLGKLVTASGDIYEGFWKNDKANGKGNYYYQNGSTFSGYWLDDLQEGEGNERWPDGAIYSGSYRNGMKNGLGKFVWPNGSEYDGEFSDNSICGRGTYIWNNGKRFTGEWKNNLMEGKGVFDWPNGKKYEGQYFQDKRWGKFYWPDGRTYEGEFWKGKQHGRGYYINENGDIFLEEWRHGQKIRQQQVDKMEDVNQSNYKY